MVAHNLAEAETDLLFHALADATRRDIVRRVIQEEQSVTALAEKYDVSFAAVQKQVAVLERAALVVKQRRGREQIVHSDLATIRKASLLLDQYASLWQERADRMATVLADFDQSNSTTTGTTNDEHDDLTR